MYDFSDHRHEKNYELWNAQAKEYKKKVKEVLKEMDKKESSFFSHYDPSICRNDCRVTSIGELFCKCNFN